MATISEKLEKIAEYKNDIKTAIENKGVEVGNSPLADYASKIDTISSGGIELNLPTTRSEGNQGPNFITLATGLTKEMLAPIAGWSSHQYCFSRMSKIESYDDILPESLYNTTNLNSCFYNNASLKSMKLPLVPKVTSISNLFGYDSYLTEVMLPDLSNVSSANSPFAQCARLTTITSNPESPFAWKKANFNIAQSPLTRESALVIINGLYDWASEGSTSTHTVTFSSTTKALLSDDDIAIATNKGWTIA